MSKNIENNSREQPGYDATLQMYRAPMRDPDINWLKFLRNLVESNRIGSGAAGPSCGEFAYYSSGDIGLLKQPSNSFIRFTTIVSNRTYAAQLDEILENMDRPIEQNHRHKLLGKKAEKYVAKDHLGLETPKESINHQQDSLEKAKDLRPKEPKESVTYDRHLHMFIEKPEIDFAKLKFLRWMAEQDKLEHGTFGRVSGEFSKQKEPAVAESK